MNRYVIADADPDENPYGDWIKAAEFLPFLRGLRDCLIDMREHYLSAHAPHATVQANIDTLEEILMADEDCG